VKSETSRGFALRTNGLLCTAEKFKKIYATFLSRLPMI
jgi:hypothetical protein